MTVDRAALLKAVGRLVVKVGSSTLTHKGKGLDYARLERLVREIADLVGQGKDVILVTSGAIATGALRLNKTGKSKDMGKKQALAAVGQGILIGAYAKLFAEYGLNVGQVLLTRDDLDAPERRANARRTLRQLFRWETVPVINENDSVAVEEIRWGENDTLSARVAELVRADLLLLLTDTPGLFSADPRLDQAAVFLPVVVEITPEIVAAAGGTGSAVGSGGMATKLEAARIATAAQTVVVIADGSVPGIIGEVLAGRAGTFFLPQASKKTRSEGE